MKDYQGTLHSVEVRTWFVVIEAVDGARLMAPVLAQRDAKRRCNFHQVPSA